MPARIKKKDTIIKRIMLGSVLPSKFGKLCLIDSIEEWEQAIYKRFSWMEEEREHHKNLLKILKEIRKEATRDKNYFKKFYDRNKKFFIQYSKKYPCVGETILKFFEDKGD